MRMEWSEGCRLPSINTILFFFGVSRICLPTVLVLPRRSRAFERRNKGDCDNQSWILIGVVDALESFEEFGSKLESHGMPSFLFSKLPVSIGSKGLQLDYYGEDGSVCLAKTREVLGAQFSDERLKREAGEVKNEEEGLRIRIDMPGAAKKSLKMRIKKETKALVVSAMAPKKWNSDSGSRMYKAKVFVGNFYLF
ncbi:hypothetical protein Droror1_Dr00000109 [Drosera rotundifolia]